jgi:hypothetical protein
MKTAAINIALLLSLSVAAKAQSSLDENTEKAPVTASLAGPLHWQQATANQHATQDARKDSTSRKKDETVNMQKSAKQKSKSGAKKKGEKQVGKGQAQP